MQSVQYIDGRQGRIDPSDRGLAYGDGLFETMLARDGRIRWLEYHLDRLSVGCQRLDIPLPSREALHQEILSRLPPKGAAIVKLILTRGVGRRGYAPPPQSVPAVIIFVDDVDIPGTPDAVGAAILELRLAEHEILAGIKHLCRIEQVLATLELKSRKVEEGILLSRSGIVVGCTSSNLFVVTGESVKTPRIRLAGIAGVMRRVVLEAARASGIAIEEAEIGPQSLHEADELFLTNAVVGLRRINSLDGRLLAPDIMTTRLREAVEQYTHA